MLIIFLLFHFININFNSAFHQKSGPRRGGFFITTRTKKGNDLKTILISNRKKQRIVPLMMTSIGFVVENENSLSFFKEKPDKNGNVLEHHLKSSPNLIIKVYK